ncbi:hypothetical protein FBY21_1615 [Pseudomonas sp. SLBN-26]|uniref:ApeA N-terminal domain 1-containing protein n=1 Tax=Pseudomonadaceae TaxID=135621 RepID=UPI001153E976|nr:MULTISPECIES: HEPN domain-containing protein [Pseudomonas]MCP1617014.1 hypothetical protein [Pseudomonas otitidis]TQL06258.1 hypothetical protein FBY21_1615 [Pseudomonas sp. SLBN-26]
MNLDKEINSPGLFWTPGNEDAKIPGILKISDGGEITVETTSDKDISSSDLHVDRILGHIETLGYVTLDDCFYWVKNSIFGLNQLSTSKIKASRAYIGAISDDDSPLLFTKFIFDIELLNDWLRLTGIKVDIDYARGTGTVTYEPQPPIHIELDEIKISIKFRHSIPSPNQLTEAKITHSAYFEISTAHPKNIDFFVSQARKTASFFCIATDQVVGIKNVEAIIPATETTNGRDIKVGVFYRSLPFSTTRPTLRSRHDFPFTFPQISSHFQEIIKCWMNNFDSLYPSINTYISTKDGTHKYLENKFLSLAQALETFSRSTNTETQFEEEEFSKLCETLIRACPEGHKEWLARRLTHANEPNLSKRLKTLFQPFNEQISIETRKVKSTIRKIVDSRNYLTHLDNASKDKCASPKEMVELTHIMDAVFILTLLRHTGIHEEVIEYIIQSPNIKRRFTPFY